MPEGLIEAILAEKPTTTLFHYTSQAGLLGILQTKSLWASKIHYLNDAAEFSYAIQLVRSYLQTVDPSAHSPGKLPLSLTWLSELYESLLKTLDQISQVNIFVFALSEQGDLLSQWRGYCPDGIGYSIGFEYEDLSEPMQRQGFRLVKCVYETEQQRAIIGELIEGAKACLRDGSLRQYEIPDEIKRAVQVFQNGFLSIAPAMKDPSFREEQEWRLVSGPISIEHPSIGGRPGKSMIIPYFEFKLAKATGEVTISKIYVGPNPHMHLSMESVVAALHVSGIKWRGVGRSMIPYRGW